MANSDSGHNSAHIGIKVDPETKQKWVEHANKNAEFGNLSRLIRVAVEGMIESGPSREQPNAGQAGLSPELERKLRGTHETVEELVGRLDEIESRLGEIEHHMSRESGISQLENRVHELLPTVEPGSDEWAAVDGWLGDIADRRAALEGSDFDPTHIAPSEIPDGCRETTSGRPDEISEIIGSSERWVRAALEQLTADLGHVHRTTVDGMTYYWRED